MWARDGGLGPVVESRESGKVVGVITDRDICIAAYTRGRPLAQIPIDEAMAKRVHACRASDDVSAAERTMQQAQVHRLPVLDASEQLVGVLSLADIARASARGKQAGVTPGEVGETLAAIRRSRALAAARAS